MTALLTYEQAGALLGVSHWTIRRYVARRKLKVVRLSGATKRIRPADLDKLVEALTA
jgi:excisionase family DNA binding protein